MGSAEFIKETTTSAKAKQRLYKLNPPFEGHEYIIVSAVEVTVSGPETYVFAANEKGEVTDWCELGGSFKGSLDHKKALNNIGYTEEQ